MQNTRDRSQSHQMTLINTGIPTKNLECLRSLYLSDPQDDLAAVRSAKGDRVPGTCEWILTQDQYTTFLVEDGPRLLWLSGGPGIGKTMISCFLVTELAHLAEQSSQMTLAYYFCDDKDEKRRTATAILRGLILQLLRQRPVLFKHIQPSFDMSGDSLCTNFHTLWRIFVSIVCDPGVGEVCCLIDALDECERESRQLFMKNLAEIFGPRENRTSSAKFIVISRRESDIEEELLSARSARILEIHVDKGKVNRDLSKFIDFKVDQLSTVKGYKPAQREKIRCALTEKAGGTFLYVSLVLYDIKRTKIMSQVIQKLQELPSDLNKVYDRILRLIDADCEEIAKIVLCWVTVARRPLTIDELAMALAFGTGRWKKNTLPPEEFLDELRDCFRSCEPLVYVDPERNTINLVHQSAKEYLLSTYLQKRDGLSQYHIQLDRTNQLVFRICWVYLSLDEFEQGTVLIERKPNDVLVICRLTKKLVHDHCFLQYAFQEWQDHALAAGPALATDHEFWKGNLNKVPTFRDHWLLDAAAEGELLLVQRLLEEGAEPDSRDIDQRTSLSWAAGRGYEAIVKLLLSRDDVALDERDIRGQTSLSHAAEKGHEAVVKLFLSRDDVVVDSQDVLNQTPLSYAAEKGHEAVVKLLLSRDDVVVDSQDCLGRTPLNIAARYGYETITTLLLNRGAIVDSRDNQGKTPLSHAVEEGHEAMVKLLLSQVDVTVDSRDNDGRTPLSHAALRGREVVVKLFLSRDDVAVDSRDKWGLTPLHLAVWNGNEAVIKLLLSRDDVEVDSRDKCGQSPLDLAKERRHYAVVRLLEDKMREENSTARKRKIEEVSDG